MTAYRKIVAIFLLIGIVINCFNHWLLFSSYSYNKAYIASVLCTNKDKPELHCEGKCFMDIKLKDLEEKNKHAQENLKRMIETLAPVSANLLAQVFEISIKLEIPPYLQQKPIGNAVSIFQPPKQV
ncbi:hypothetical protein [Pedobacter insulae]|uniref:Uncharacterized protein n=1 Tax=Pedobacter insulae TaxID=414048 RepID=A0A1I3A5T7_9SPHI|nr:hypothetical protein [Pedobacter insulae]SFH45368.1 hypothetical protein SAMN04489864_11321 [Pedobacter insulae]